MAARSLIDVASGGQRQTLDPKRDEVLVLAASAATHAAWLRELSADDFLTAHDQGKDRLTLPTSWPGEYAVVLSLGRDGASIRFWHANGVGFFYVTAAGRSHVYSSGMTLRIPPGNPRSVLAVRPDDSDAQLTIAPSLPPSGALRDLASPAPLSGRVPAASSLSPPPAGSGEGLHAEVLASGEQADATAFPTDARIPDVTPLRPAFQTLQPSASPAASPSPSTSGSTSGSTSASISGARPNTPAPPPGRRKAAPVAEEILGDGSGIEALGAPAVLVGQALDWAQPHSRLLPLKVRVFGCGGGDGYICVEGEAGEQLSFVPWKSGSEPVVAQVGSCVAIIAVNDFVGAARATPSPAPPAPPAPPPQAPPAPLPLAPQPLAPQPKPPFEPYCITKLLRTKGIPINNTLPEAMSGMPEGDIYATWTWRRSGGYVMVPGGTEVECGSYLGENYRARGGVFCRLPQVAGSDPAWANAVFLWPTSALEEPPQRWPAKANELRPGSTALAGAFDALRAAGSTAVAAAEAVEAILEQQRACAAAARVPVRAMLRLQSEGSAAACTAELLARVRAARDAFRRHRGPSDLARLLLRLG